MNDSCIDDAFWLVAARRLEAIRDLEQKTGLSQDEMVDTFIENTNWGADLPRYRGNRGTARA